MHKGSEPYYARICPLWPCYHYHLALLGRSWPSKVYSIGSRHTSGGLSKRWSTKNRNAVLTVMNNAASAPARRGESPATNGTSRVCGWSRRPRMVRMDVAQHASTGGYLRARPCCLLSRSANVVKRAAPERLRVHSARDWSKQSTCGFQGDTPRIARRIPLQMAPHHRRACARSLVCTPEEFNCRV